MSHSTTAAESCLDARMHQEKLNSEVQSSDVYQLAYQVWTVLGLSPHGALYKYAKKLKETRSAPCRCSKSTLIQYIWLHRSTFPSFFSCREQHNFLHLTGHCRDRKAKEKCGKTPKNLRAFLKIPWLQRELHVVSAFPPAAALPRRGRALEAPGRQRGPERALGAAGGRKQQVRSHLQALRAAPADCRPAASPAAACQTHSAPAYCASVPAEPSSKAAIIQRDEQKDAFLRLISTV